MLEVKNLSKTIGNFTISNISISLSEGDYFVLLGPSGAGKTVLLESLAGIIKPDNGSVILNGNNITNYNTQKRKIGLLFQDQALFPHMNVKDNIQYGLKCRDLKKEDILSISGKLASEYGLSDLLHRYPATLSGGEKQRVALARIMATEPSVLLLDEPLSALDPGSKREIRKLLGSLKEKNVAVIHVTHDYEEALTLATKLGIMEQNTVTRIGTSEEIFHHPGSGFVAEFIGIKNFYCGTLVKKDNNRGVFTTDNISFSLLTKEDSGSGSIIINSEDVTLSTNVTESSARNTFEGVVTEICPAKLGKEIILDIGIELAALITDESVEALKIQVGKTLYATLKATSIKYKED